VTVPAPQPVDLTAEEQSLLDEIDFDLSGSPESRVRSCAAGADLAESIFKRKAVPKIRLRYFTEPALNVGGRGKSRQQGFERNGVRGKAILEHPNFLRYLRYFLFGPDLPADTINRFRQVLIDDAGTSGMILDALCRCARSETRRLAGGYDIAEEFFKLALECGVDEWIARSVRTAAMRAS
jgi:hypothetical protein